MRPGLIVGPHDPTGRFTYWAHRLERGGEILAPGPPERRVQFIDVRDLAEWMVDCVERRVTGVFNAMNEGVAWGELLAGADVTWVSDESSCVEQEVGEWMELPLWIARPGAGPGCSGPSAAPSPQGCASGRSRRRSPAPADAPAVEGVGLTPEREAELLEAWRER